MINFDEPPFQNTGGSKAQEGEKSAGERIAQYLESEQGQTFLEALKENQLPLMQQLGIDVSELLTKLDAPKGGTHRPSGDTSYKNS